MKKWAYYNEVDPYCCEWIRNLINAGLVTDGEIDSRSIVDVRPDDVRDFERCHWFSGIAVWDYALGLAGWDRPGTLWTGSCPCQPFSSAGRRAGFDDERHLWPAWFDLIRECRPDTILGEQVDAAARLGWLDAVFADLEGQDYACGSVVLGAQSVGAPHIRQRLWFVADAHGQRRDGQSSRLRGAGSAGRDAADRDEVAGSREAGVVADAEGRGRPRAGELREPSGRPSPAYGCDARGLGDADSLGKAPQRGIPGRADADGEGDFWAAAEWLPCRDGKLRPTQPGLQPLVDGAAFKLGSGSAFEGRSRVGMLKGAGNAINAKTAAQFIAAVRDTLALESSAP